MKRSTFTFQTNLPKQAVEPSVLALLKKHDFRSISYKNEPNVYKTGYNILLAPQYLHCEVYDNFVQIDAWVKPFGFFGESDLEGFTGAIPKQKVKNTVQAIFSELPSYIYPQQVYQPMQTI